MMKAASLALMLSGQTLAFTAKSNKSFLRVSFSPLHAAFSPDDNSQFDNDMDDNDHQDPGNNNNRNDKIVMSKSIPFLPCPAPLVDCAFSGNVGFDPLGLAQNKEQLWQYRESEIKHARLAMLAAVGWPASELWNRAIASQFDMDPILDVSDRAPSLLNGGMDRVSPVWWGFCIGLCAAIEVDLYTKARRGDKNYQPGKLGFDPLGLYPVDRKGQKWMDEAEIKHGRLAMVSVVMYCWEEWVTKLAVVDETRMLFQPFARSVELLEEVVAEEASPLLMTPMADTIGQLAFE